MHAEGAVWILDDCIDPKLGLPTTAYSGTAGHQDFDSTRNALLENSYGTL